MYTFVLEWTPALTPQEPPKQLAKQSTGGADASDQKRHLLSADDADDDGHIGAIPHGYIFAAFMVCTIGKNLVVQVYCKSEECIIYNCQKVQVKDKTWRRNKLLK